MSAVSRTISYRLTAGNHVGDTGGVNLNYDPVTPFNVGLDFGPDDPVWVVWRDVLARRVDSVAEVIRHDGLLDGGASCMVAGCWAYLTLAGHNGTVTLQMLTAGLDAFLRDTERLVPYGEERIDMDAELASLLGGTR